MKKVLLTVAVAFSLSAFTVEGYAQNSQPIKYYSTEVMDEINASETQRAAVKELVAKYNVLLKEVKSNNSLTAEESKAETRRLTSERAKEYWKILNPEQTKYLKEKKKGN